MTSVPTPEQVRDTLRREVGGFFTNTRRGLDTCAVCTGPATTPLCAQCAAQRERYGAALADQVVLLAYAKGGTVPRHQSEYHVYNYKKGLGSSPECQRDLKLMMLGATLVHGGCIAQRFGPWGTITFVSSRSRPGTAHPVVELAKMVESPGGPEPAKILLDIGPDIAAEPTRFPLPRRFEVAERWQPDVQGKHVLVVDDTWVSGDKSQSASLALKACGARAVTILCVARWLSWTYSAEHQQLIKARTEPYDALLCPVTGGGCPTNITHIVT